MSKKILKLTFDRDYDFSLAGIVSGSRDYKVCFELNRALGLNFTRQNDVSLETNMPGSNTTHAYFRFSGHIAEDYHLISNRDKANTGFYIPEMREIDYFLLVSGANNSFEIDNLVSKIRTIEIISGVYAIDPLQLKSVEAFLLFIEG